MKKRILVLFVLLTSVTYAQHLSIDYTLWDKLLQKYVTEDGFVDYDGFIKDKKELVHFTQYLSQFTLQPYWSEAQKKAYLINTYNAYTILLIVQHHPIESIKNIGSEEFYAFTKDFIPYGNRLISLDYLEKKLLLPLGDARIHFAINCAAFSCPPLTNIAFDSTKIEQQLNKVTIDFIRSTKNNLSEKKIYLSAIFKWYKNDFVHPNQSIIDYINTYSKIKVHQDATISYLDYNWSLNSIDNLK